MTTLKTRIPDLRTIATGLLLVSGLQAHAMQPVGAPGANPLKEPRRPNILFIFSDDHSTRAIGTYAKANGFALKDEDMTPNLDKLAAQGMRMDRVFCTNSICTPSRAAVMTGQYRHKNGVPIFNAISTSTPVFTQELQKAGYWTSLVGKWHLGSNPQGFDHWEIFPGQGAYENPPMYTAAGKTQHKGYASDILTDLAIKQLENRPKDKPFFLMVNHKAPHRNWIPHPRHAALYKDRTFATPATLLDDYATRTDAIREQEQSLAKHMRPKIDLKVDKIPNLPFAERQRWIYNRYMQDYLGCVRGVDESIGAILKYLDEHDLARNTIVAYSSDQGFFLGEHGLYDKRFMYDESHRMPFIIRWPGVTKPGSASKAMATNCDFAPTFLDAAGIAKPERMQGHSLKDALAGNPGADWPKSVYYRYYVKPGDEHNVQPHYGVRTERYKLIHFWYKDQWECYDLQNDPNEIKNIYNDPKAQDIVRQLKTELERIRKEVDDKDEYSTPETLPKGPFV